jgi:hypothetical protein
LFSFYAKQVRVQDKINKAPYSTESDLLLATFCPMKNTVPEAERGEWWDTAPACA